MKKYLMLFILSSLCIGLRSQTFSDVTNQANIQVQLPAMGDLVLWFDYDNDGWLDFFGGTEYENFLFRNNGDGTFANIITGSGLENIFPKAVAIGDCDNDGFDDLLVSSFHVSVPPKVFKNLNGKGFAEAYNAPVSNGSFRAIWLDFNGDGKLDFVTCSHGGNTLLFLNKGNCQFEQATGIDSFNTGMIPAAADFDNDGLQDIYVAIESTTKTNRLYRNIAGSAIQDVTFSAGVSDYRNSVSAAWGDMNNDGFLDLYVANISSNRNVLLYNRGNSTFEDRTLAAGVSDAGDARTSAWQDVNNDGLIDLFTTNHVATNKLFLNNGDGTFTNIAPQANISGPSDGFGVSWGDYDKDGDLDVLICGHSFGPALLRNNLNNGNSFLNIKLVGVFDNRSAIGARVTLFSNGQMQIREVNGGQGATGQDAFPLHFGMGQQTVADSIIIRWPSGAIQKKYNIAANQHLTITQEGNIPPTRFRLISPSPDTVYQTQNLRFFWQASTDPDAGNPIHYFLRITAPDRDTLIGPINDNQAWVQMQSWMAVEPCSWRVAASDGTDQIPSWEEFSLHYDVQTSLLTQMQNASTGFSITAGSLSPNGQQIQIELFSPKEQTVLCVIYDFTGRLLQNQALHLGVGKSTHHLTLNHEVNSIIMSLQSESHKGWIKMIRQISH